MDYRGSVWYLVVALIVSVLTPAITALVNCISSYKLRKLELVDIRNTQKLEEYIKAADLCIIENQCLPVFSEIQHSVFLYVPGSCYNLIRAVNSSIQLGDYAGAYNDLQGLCSFLHESDTKGKMYLQNRKHK